LLAELAAIFWAAMKETPGQLAAPFVAFWREVLKWVDPEEGILARDQQNYVSDNNRSGLAAELAAIFWAAAKETPGQMAAPWVAFWREVLKWGDPERGTIKRE
jgi:hypothetical protein